METPRVLPILTAISGLAITGADTTIVESLPKGWLITIIGLLLTTVGSMGALLGWFVKRTVTKFDNDRNELSALIIATQNLTMQAVNGVTNLRHELEVHQNTEEEMMKRFITRDDLGSTIARIYDRMNADRIEVERRFVILETKQGLHEAAMIGGEEEPKR